MWSECRKNNGNMPKLFPIWFIKQGRLYSVWTRFYNHWSINTISSFSRFSHLKIIAKFESAINFSFLLIYEFIQKIEIKNLSNFSMLWCNFPTPSFVIEQALNQGFIERGWLKIDILKYLENNALNKVMYSVSWEDYSKGSGRRSSQSFRTKPSVSWWILWKKIFFEYSCFRIQWPVSNSIWTKFCIFLELYLSD